MTGDLRLAVFDVDGTLIDSLSDILAAMKAAFAAEGHGPPNETAARRVIGLPLVEAIAVLLPGEKAHRHERAAEAYKQAYLARVSRAEEQAALFPGALEALAELDQAGYLLGLATSKSRRGVDRFVATHGLDGRFVTVQTPDRGPSKPNPEVLRLAMAEAGVAAGATVMVGDTTYDMTMARDAGAVPIGVAWGYHDKQELTDCGAAAVIETFAELPQVIHRLMGE